MTFLFLHAQSNPANLTGTVGGAISNTPLSGFIDELLYRAESPPSGTNEVFYQYRKIFVKNTYSTTSTSTKVWLDAVEHPEQIAICLCSGLNDTVSNPTGQAPVGVTGWVVPTSYVSGLSIGTMATNYSTGLWIREALSGITNADPYSSFRIYCAGVVG